MIHSFPTPQSPVLSSYVEFVRNEDARSGVSPSFVVSYRCPESGKTEYWRQSKTVTDEECDRLSLMSGKELLNLAEKWCDSIWNSAAKELLTKGIDLAEADHDFLMNRYQIRHWLKDEANRWKSNPSGVQE